MRVEVTRHCGNERRVWQFWLDVPHGNNTPVLYLDEFRFEYRRSPRHKFRALPADTYRRLGRPGVDGFSMPLADVPKPGHVADEAIQAIRPVVRWSFP
jgi:hypothetical protein